MSRVCSTLKGPYTADPHDNLLAPAASGGGIDDDGIEVDGGRAARVPPVAAKRKHRLSRRIPGRGGVFPWLDKTILRLQLYPNTIGIACVAVKELNLDTLVFGTYPYCGNLS